MARMTMSKEELAILRKAIAENAYLLDGIEEGTFANSKTAEFVDQYGIDEADELIEFICNRPDEMYF